MDAVHEQICEGLVLQDRSSWQTFKFAEIADSITDRVDDPGSSGVEHYVGLEHLDPESLHIRRWGKPDDVEATKLRFQPGDIIYGRRRAYQKKLAVAEFEGICSAHALVLRARQDVVLPEFLPFFMQSDIFHERALAISVGSLSPTINWKTLAAQEFALPPKPEQHRIAEILWAADAVEQAWSEAASVLSLLRDKLIFSLYEKFGALKYTLGELCDGGGIQIGPFGSQLHASDYSADGVPVVMPSDLDRDAIQTAKIARVPGEVANRLRLHALNEGDILLPRRGDLSKRGLVTRQEQGWLCGTGCIRVRLKKSVNAEAAFISLSTAESSEWLLQNAVGTTMPNLNSSIVDQMPVVVPPPASSKKFVQALETLRINNALTQDHLLKTRGVVKQLRNVCFR